MLSSPKISIFKKEQYRAGAGVGVGAYTGVGAGAKIKKKVEPDLEPKLHYFGSVTLKSSLGLPDLMFPPTKHIL